MSQMSTPGVNVVNAAGDPAQNAATTGANQRAKAEIAVREQELKLEQAKIKVEKYGIDTQTSNYAALNKSHEQMQTQQIGAQQQMQTQELAARAAENQKQQDFLKAQDQRHLKMDILDRQAKLKGLKASLAGLESTDAELESHKKDWLDNRGALEAAMAAQASANEALPVVVKRFADQMGPILQGANSEYSNGSQAAHVSSTNFWRATQDPSFFQSKDAQYQPSDMPFTGGAVHSNLNPREAAEKGLIKMAQDVAPLIVNQGADAGRVTMLLQAVMQNHVRAMEAASPSVTGEQFDPPAEYTSQIEAAMKELAAMKTPDGKPAVQMYGLTAWMDNLKQWGRFNKVKEEMTSDQIESQLGAMEALGISDAEKPYFRTAWADPEQRKGLMMTAKYASLLSNSVETSAGKGVMHRPKNLDSYVDAYTQGLSMYHSPEEVKKALAEAGFTLDITEEGALRKSLSGPAYEKFKAGGPAKETLKTAGAKAARDDWDARHLETLGQISSKRGESQAEEEALRDELHMLDE